MNNVAFDLHSDNVFVRVDDANGQKLFEKRIINDLSVILAELAPYLEEAQFVMESTGNWYWLFDGLQDAGFKRIYLANSLKLHAISAAKVKTDARDARKLNQLLRTGDLPLAYAYPRGRREVRDLLRHRADLVQQRAGGYLNLRSTLRKYNVKGDMSTAKLKGLSELEVDKLPLPGLVQLWLKVLVRKAQYLSQEVALLEEALRPLGQAEPMVTRLMAMPGVGTVLAMTIFYESGDVGRFPSQQEYCSFCRGVKGSGNSNRKVGPGRKGKEGNAYLKSAYMQAASGARIDERLGRLKKRYQETHAGKAVKLRALNMVAHKLAIAVYQMLRKEEAFDEGKFYAGMTTDSPTHSTRR